SQDMVLGIYYMTRIKKGVKGEGKFFKDVNEVMLAAQVGAVHLQAAIKVMIDGKWVETSPGRVFLNDNMPDGIEFINRPLKSKDIGNLIAEVYKTKGPALTVRMLDAIKDTGYKYAMIFGATIGLEDIKVPEKKQTIIDKAQAEADQYYRQFKEGTITKEERYEKVTDVWRKAQSELGEALDETYKNDRDGFNPVYMMADSGARGSATQMRQLSGMRGLMQKPGGETIELPIKSNFKEGLNVIEFYISTNGARKGLADTALRTADAGYLTRRLVDVSQDVITNELDCGTINGIEMGAIKDGDKIIESLRDRILGRFAVEDVVEPITGELIVGANEAITEDVVDKIEKANIETVKVRTVLTCETKRGVCVKCYGRNLATNQTVDKGEAVGIIAAQSIGQPGTQLTMRTFHEGGIDKGSAADNTVKREYKVFLDNLDGKYVVLDNGNKLFTRKSYLYISRIISEYDIANCNLLIEEGAKVFIGKEVMTDASGKIVKAETQGYAKIRGNKLYLTAASQELEVGPGSQMFQNVGETVDANQPILEFDPFV
ncbi:MAG: DNA-directed RNA polymerase subunit beta', partial [Spirochaetales bacterium]|nr:DNA-directed RNA polymerase subunit beta' [Spirochaetales bacterium]